MYYSAQGCAGMGVYICTCGVVEYRASENVTPGEGDKLYCWKNVLWVGGWVWVNGRGGGICGI